MASIQTLIPRGMVALGTHTYTPFYPVIGEAGSIIIGCPGILVPEDWVTTTMRRGRQLCGVSFSRLRDNDWRLITGLHPYMNDCSGGYTASIRLNHGYYVPHTGLHSVELARRYRNDDVIADAEYWHELFTFNRNRLAWPIVCDDQHRLKGWELGENLGWITITVDNESWYMHTSVAALERLLAQYYKDTDCWHISCKFGIKQLEIQVPEDDIERWQQAEGGHLAQNLARALHLNSVVFEVIQL